MADRLSSSSPRTHVPTQADRTTDTTTPPTAVEEQTVAQQLAALVQNSDEPPAHDHVQQTYAYEALVEGRLERRTCNVSMKNDTVAVWQLCVVPFLKTGKVSTDGTQIANWCLSNRRSALLAELLRLANAQSARVGLVLKNPVCVKTLTASTGGNLSGLHLVFPSFGNDASTTVVRLLAELLSQHRSRDLTIQVSDRTAPHEACARYKQLFKPLLGCPGLGLNLQNFSRLRGARIGRFPERRRGAEVPRAPANVPGSGCGADLGRANPDLARQPGVASASGAPAHHRSAASHVRVIGRRVARKQHHQIGDSLVLGSDGNGRCRRDAVRYRIRSEGGLEFQSGSTDRTRRVGLRGEQVQGCQPPA